MPWAGADMDGATAPAVRYSVGASTVLQLLLLALASLGLMTGLAWAAAAGPWFWRTLPPWLWLLVYLFSVLGAWHQLRVLEPAQLVWNGAQWSMMDRQGRRDLADLRVALDLQFALLLRAVNGASGRRCWLWVERQTAQMRRWHLLRCAAHHADVRSF